MRKRFFTSAILMSVSLFVQAQNFEDCEIGYCSKCHKKFTRKVFFQPFGHQSIEGKETIAGMAQFEPTGTYDQSCNQQVKEEKVQEKTFDAQKEKTKNGEEILEWHPNGKAAITRVASMKKLYKEDGSLLFSYEFNTEDAKFYKDGKVVAYGKGKLQENPFMIEKEEDLLIKYGTWVENGAKVEYVSGNKITYQEGKAGNNTYKGYLTESGVKNGKYEEYYPGGQLFIKCVYLENKKNGSYEEYYENGKLCVKTIYKNDLEDGFYLRYHANGKVFQKAFFKDGKLDGALEQYFESGQIELKGNYKAGKLEGIFELYYLNGQLESKKTYTHGECNMKDYILYNEKGEVIGKGDYINGEFTGYSQTQIDEDVRKQLLDSDHSGLAADEVIKEGLVDGAIFKYSKQAGKYDGKQSVLIDGKLIYRLYFTKGALEYIIKFDPSGNVQQVINDCFNKEDIWILFKEEADEKFYGKALKYLIMKDGQLFSNMMTKIADNKDHDLYHNIDSTIFSIMESDQELRKRISDIGKDYEVTKDLMLLNLAYKNYQQVIEYSNKFCLLFPFECSRKNDSDYLTIQIYQAVAYLMMNNEKEGHRVLKEIRYESEFKQTFNQIMNNLTTNGIHNDLTIKAREKFMK
jgi:antitoxin component YwqK of YwqJK toxin-antitoxin module